MKLNNFLFQLLASITFIAMNWWIILKEILPLLSGNEDLHFFSIIQLITSYLSTIERKYLLCIYTIVQMQVAIYNMSTCTAWEIQIIVKRLN